MLVALALGHTAFVVASVSAHAVGILFGTGPPVLVVAQRPTLHRFGIGAEEAPLETPLLQVSFGPIQVCFPGVALPCYATKETDSSPILGVFRS